MNTVFDPEQISMSRLPGDAHIGAITLRVTDIARSLGFYRGILGLTASDVSLNSAKLAPAAHLPVLIHLTRVSHARQGRTTGLYHFALRVPGRPELASMLLRLVKADYPLDGASDHDVSEALYLSDPDGNGIEIYHDRPRDEWKWRNGEVHMTLAAVDLQGLLKIAAADAATAAPHGLDMGHVHLQVSDLSESTRFYRDIVGLDVTSNALRGAAFLSAGGYHHHLGINTWSATSRRADIDGPGLTDWELVVPDTSARAALIGRLRDASAQEIAVTDGFRFLDPDGTGLYIRQ